ncbi:hypothetical protein ccbrp13_26400 [Ktedonobacteria bacterium brp13]|nr:hypothetical protein ccbrp13_26400 [Ktedonobacteria bacterium brp13]
MTAFELAPSLFVPIAIGFFGLGTGYLIWGGQEVFGFPTSNPEVNRTMSIWAFWMSGFMQFITGVYLLTGLTWFQVFSKPPATTSALYMAALAFTAYGTHWFALAHRRYIGASDQPEGWMSIAFFLLSLLGVIVFIAARDVPVAIVFIGLALIYLTAIPTHFGIFPGGVRLTGVWRLLTGIWLMYMTWAVVLNLSIGAHWWT